MIAHSLTFSKFNFIIAPAETMLLPPFIGSTIRGGFGYALKRLTCTQGRQRCEECLINGECAYFQIFESPRMIDSAERRASHDPHIFIIEPPLPPRGVYLAGEQFSFGLILIGRGIAYLPYFIVAFTELGKVGLGGEKGKYRLVGVKDALPPSSSPVFSPVKGTTGNFTRRTFKEVAKEVRGINAQQVRLFFLTPTRIKRQKDFVFITPAKGRSIQELVIDLDFPLFMRNLFRRLSWLAEVHCGEKWELDYPRLLEKASEIKTASSNLHWYDWERYSSRQNAKLKMGGFVGRITFEGDLAEFLPFIKMGEYLHIGQGTALGLGKYIIEQD